MTVFARDDDRSTGATDRIGTKTVAEQRAFGGELIDVGCRIDFLEPSLVRADRVGCMVVGEEEHDIRSVGGNCETGRKQEIRDEDQAMFHDGTFVGGLRCECVAQGLGPAHLHGTN